MGRFLRTPVVWGFPLCLLGVGASALPWLRLTFFGSPAAISGFDVWQGKVTAAVFAAAGLLVLAAALLRHPARWLSSTLVAAGVAVAVVAGLYVAQVVFPAPPRVTVHEGGAAARAVAEHLIEHVTGTPGIGAPAALALGLGLVVVGVREWRGTRRAPEPQR